MVFFPDILFEKKKLNNPNPERFPTDVGMGPDSKFPYN